MAKGYWIARVDVHNTDGYKDYVAQNAAVFAKFGGQVSGARRQACRPRRARRARATW